MILWSWPKSSSKVSSRSSSSRCPDEYPLVDGAVIDPPVDEAEVEGCPVDDLPVNGPDNDLPLRLC